MSNPVVMAEIWRGPFLESAHSGHAVVCDEAGEIVMTWGNPDLTVLSRSSAKMIQALPLIESGAAAHYALSTRHLAIACASHSGAEIHSELVTAWLGQLGKTDGDLRCGAHMPKDSAASDALTKEGQSPCQYHNNCSGKHAGFLTLNAHLGAGPDYIEPAHPVQLAVREAFERFTGAPVLGHGIDGCSAPNFATSLRGMAHAMARFAAADPESAPGRLVSAMTQFPELVAGETRACTRLMRAMNGKVAVKTGAEAFYVAIIPEKKLGVALKIVDGATRASECAIAAILSKLGVLDPRHPDAQRYINGTIKNWRGVETGFIRAAPALV